MECRFPERDHRFDARTQRHTQCLRVRRCPNSARLWCPRRLRGIAVCSQASCGSRRCLPVSLRPVWIERDSRLGIRSSVFRLPLQPDGRKSERCEVTCADLIIYLHFNFLLSVDGDARNEIFRHQSVFFATGDKYPFEAMGLYDHFGSALHSTTASPSSPAAATASTASTSYRMYQRTQGFTDRQPPRPFRPPRPRPRDCMMHWVRQNKQNRILDVRTTVNLVVQRPTRIVSSTRLFIIIS